MKIIPLRVDNIHHNKKIDAKIIELIKTCDFAIADLTYARPSVYYEAGRVHGMNNEVVFTCRKDHFNGIADNTKIHFDLITENVIGWGTAPKTFEKLLRARISQVILPIQRAMVAQKRVNKEKQEFALLSLSKKIEAIKIQVIKSVGVKYDIVNLDDNALHLFAGRTGKNKRDEIVFAFVDNTYTAKKIKEMWSYEIYPVMKSINQNSKDEDQNLSLSTIIFCSIAKITDATIQKALRFYAKADSREKTYIRNAKSFRFQEKVIFLDKITSIPDFGVRLDAALT